MKHRDTIEAWWELTRAAENNYPLAVTADELDALWPFRHQNLPILPLTIFGHRVVEVSDWSLLP
jgi:hypothetical protein